MTGLTPRMADCLSAIRDLSQGGVPPSYRELQDRLGLKSLSGIHRMVMSLKERGIITVADNRARSIEIVGDDVRWAAMKTAELRRLRDAIDRELRRRAW